VYVCVSLCMSVYVCVCVRVCVCVCVVCVCVCDFFLNEPRTLYIPGKNYTTELLPSPPLYFLKHITCLILQGHS
jgi:hypothetical protein